MTALRCPRCHESETRVVETRPIERGDVLRRRRECRACGHRWTTYERSA